MILDFAGTICLDILTIRREWGTSSNITDVIKAVVNVIDNPDTNRSLNIGQFFEYYFSFISQVFILELGIEYEQNREEFVRKALDYSQKHGLPRK